MSRYRPRYFDYYIRYFRPPANTQTLIEFDIPSVVADEEGLKTTIAKKEFVLLNQHREQGKPPIVRLIRKTISYTNYEELETFLAGVDKSLSNSNIYANRKHVALIVPDFTVDLKNSLNGAKAFSVTMTFERKPEQVQFNFQEFCPCLVHPTTPAASVLHSGIHLYRDMADPDNIWKIKLYMQPSSSYLVAQGVLEFITTCQRRLSATDTQYRIKMV